MTAADESVITVTGSDLAPFGKRVLLETELFCCSFYSRSHRRVVALVA